MDNIAATLDSINNSLSSIAVSLRVIASFNMDRDIQINSEHGVDLSLWGNADEHYDYDLMEAFKRTGPIMDEENA